MKVYYDILLDELVLVTHYPPPMNFYLYRSGLLSLFDSRVAPSKFKNLTYIGEFYNGDLYEHE